MSRRPNIQDPHEKRVEREIQRDRKQRDRKMKAATGKPSKAKRKPPLEPYIRSYSRGEPEGGIPKKVRAWIEEEDAVQMRNYHRIARAMEKLAPLRNRWAREFLARISGPRGFSVHAGTRRTIAKSEIPKRPRRPWRVVW